MKCENSTVVRTSSRLDDIIIGVSIMLLLFLVLAVVSTFASFILNLIGIQLKSF
jgi:hypothetical protein